MKYFRHITSHTSVPTLRNAVVMGRKTWDSIPPQFRPLSQRLNIVLSSRSVEEFGLQGCEVLSYGDSSRCRDETKVIVCSSFEQMVTLCLGLKYQKMIENVFVIGGAELFAKAMFSPFCKSIYYTHIQDEFPCDTYIPQVPPHFRLNPKPLSDERVVENGVTYSIRLYENENFLVKEAKVDPTRNLEELQYLTHVDDLIRNGIFRQDRTGTGTFAKFGAEMRFNLRDHSFPLLTTKKVFWRGVAEELFWFISGDTNAKTLSSKGIKIWDPNGSREYLDRVGLSHHEEGDLGPVYGFQWRHFGAEYTDMHANYEGKGVDQLKECIHKIKTNPTDRRIIISAWNPAAIPQMALPPCHMFCQFFVANGELSCLMYQRSCDMGLGVPFNIASYSLLTCLLAHCCDLKPGEFIHSLGDYHVYQNHIDALKEQLQREPRPFPRLYIDTDIKDIDQIGMGHLRLEGYDPYPPIKMDMSV